MLVSPVCPARKVATIPFTPILFLSIKLQQALHTSKSLFAVYSICWCQFQLRSWTRKLGTGSVTSSFDPKTLVKTDLQPVMLCELVTVETAQFVHFFGKDYLIPIFYQKTAFAPFLQSVTIRNFQCHDFGYLRLPVPFSPMHWRANKC